MIPNQQNVSAIQKLLNKLLIPTINEVLPTGGKISIIVSEIIKKDKIRAWDVPYRENDDEYDSPYLSYYVFIICEDPNLISRLESLQLGYLIYKICGYVLTGRYKITTHVVDKGYNKQKNHTYIFLSWEDTNQSYNDVLKDFLDSLREK